ncbi:hypothetical protein V5E97_24420 [Singulisphaera sp. Ch08]|uniref:Uncharacterized protein n=1 Tax=Singulisphaera sp. Ch08 TaxID=3120278 RepID=A0AAU7C881_9BACT
MTYPSELELREYFGVDPERSDDVTLFRVADVAGISLVFSYNDTDDSVQTALNVADRCISVVSHEKMSRLWIDQDTLRAEFTYSDNIVTLSLLVNPTIRVDWSGLRSS